MPRLSRTRKSSRPCLMTELLEEIAAREAVDRLPAYNQFPAAPLSRREKLLLHLSVFVVGSGTLVMINLGGDPHRLWFWPWVAGWAVLLAIHGAWALIRPLPHRSSLAD
jgi:hypothetical protein